MQYNSKKYSDETNSNLKRTIKNPAQIEFVEKKSRFIAQAFPVENIEKVENILKDVRKKFTDATHNCYAYRIGIEKNIYRFSDDGEPSGTAGKPIFQTIVKFDLTDILVVVTRYFGGIKLGASGLVRAYSKATKLVLESAEKIEIPLTNFLTLEFDYFDYPKVKRIVFENFQNVKEDFSDKVRIEGFIAINIKNDVLSKINNLLSGNLKIQ
ncbi:MAG: YigZ family protein [Candidatus Kapaibacteriota bacterium]|jgi:uncharacterized YigZ family protein